MTRARKLALSAVVLAAAVAAIGLGTYSAFSATTTNSGNSIAAGTVVLGDNDANAAMYTATNQKPGDTFQQCIKVDYTGSLSSTVKLYTASTIGALGPYIDLQIRTGSGSPTFPGCVGFTADGADLYSGTLSNFASTYTNWNAGEPNNFNHSQFYAYVMAPHWGKNGAWDDAPGSSTVDNFGAGFYGVAEVAP